mmetsp:Transcript_19273/g.40427  ORF Transcript_19273/g.40427 Transcript_19273/m.40427 type:complete len:566 (+) Transcript_19273:508-2205(+)
MTASHASVRRTVLTTTALFLFFLSSPTPASAATIFEAKFPTACVNPLLSLAGFCALNNGCTKTCFKSSKTFGSASGSTTSTVSDTTPASPLALFAQALDNFYVPVDAVDCNEFEDPICPATTCCPACEDELIELYQCLILESNYQNLDPLARDCPIDCKPPAKDNTAAPVEAPMMAPVPVPTMAPIPAPTMAPVPSPTFAPVPPFTMAPVPLPTMAPVPAPTMAPVPIPTIAPVPVSTIPLIPISPPVSVPTIAPVPVITSQQKPVATRPKTFLVPNWVVPEANENPFRPMTIRVQDSLIFVWKSGTHDVYMYPNANSANPCNSTNKILIGDTTSNPTMFTFREYYAGKTVRFACDIGNHCSAGMHLEVTILPLPVVEQAQQTAPPAPAPTNPPKSPPVPVTMTVITKAPVPPATVATTAPAPVTTTTIVPKAHTAPNWVIPSRNGLGIPYTPIMVRVGDSLTFAWDTGKHDVYIYPNANAPNHCDSTDKILVGDKQSNPTTYVFTDADAGKTLHFACDIPAHCEAGMRMNVAVLAVTPPAGTGTVPLTTGTTSVVEAIAKGGIP